MIIELVALLNSLLRIPRVECINFIDGIKTSSLVDVIYIDREMGEQALQLLSNRRDKNWSLVDCSSFIVMKENSLEEAMTTDHHFEQAGFIRLLK